jgi:hypothetical protein
VPKLLEKVKTNRRPAAKSWGGNPTIWEQDALRFAMFGAGPSLGDTESIDHDFVSYVLQAIGENPIIFGAKERRRQVFAQANFMWQTMESGRGGKLSSTAALDVLRKPWPNGSLPELLGRMEGDVTAAGNFYATLVDERGKIGRAAKGSATARISRLRPDWITIVIGVPKESDADVYDPRARIISYLYRTPRNREPLTLLPEEVCHYSPVPDLISRFRGMSWLTPVLLEILADKAATQHKLNFFANGAVHAMAIKYPPNTSAQLLREYKKLYDEEYAGVDNHYKTFHIAGADPIPMSADFQQLDLKHTQGAGETRIALAAGVPAAILGISEGLEGSTLNQGNFGAARRLFVDTTIRDLWSMAGPALETLFTPPQQNQRLWYDPRDVPFLREDAKDDAAIKNQDAQTLKALVEAGWDWNAAVEYVTTGDLANLKNAHSGLLPVQLQPPGQTNQPPAGAPSGSNNSPQNGSGRNGNTVEAAARR